jgi:hypothetical protein
MGTLEKVLEGLTEWKVDNNFRLWLTTAPSPIFPISVL